MYATVNNGCASPDFVGKNDTLTEPLAPACNLVDFITLSPGA